MGAPIIGIRSLSVKYGTLPALTDVSMSIPERKVTALIGASGSGKSTFLRSMNRMLDTIPDTHVEGKIFFNGRNILNPEINVTVLRKSIGMVFQNPIPFPKSIYGNVAYGLELQGMKNRRSRNFALFRRRIVPEDILRSDDPLDREVVRALKEAALWNEVKDRLHVSAFALSGGQQQRLSIARTIAIKPEVILFDEPCSLLDPISMSKIEDLIVALKKHYTIVIVTHNMPQARRISDFVGFFHIGRLIEFGATTDLFEKPQKKLTREYVQGQFG